MFSKRILLIMLLLCSCWYAAAQEITGTIVGTVKDQSGAAVPKATVTITNTDQNVVVRTVTTDEHGDYVATSLPIGHYSVTFNASGFGKSSLTNIELNTNAKLTENIALKVGNSNETVNVAADAQQVELQSATASGLINGTQIRELSLNSRNYEQLVSLVPGVSYGGSDQLYIGVTSPDGSSNRINFAINGGRKSENFWTIDGADNVDRGANLTLLNYPSVDAIAEFKVVRGLYNAESGRGGAGQINVVTRSGTSSFHGGAYEFVRNDLFNAIKSQPLLATPPTRPKLRYNDFGYNVGGPVYIPGVYNTKKDKTFFFFSQEFRRVLTYDSRNINLPTAGQLAGTFTNQVCVSYSAPIGGTCTLGNQITNIDPTAAAYIKDIYSKAGVAPTSGATTGTSPVNVFNARQELYKIDHNFGPKLSLSGKFLKDSIPTVEPGGLFTAVFLPGVSTTSTDSPGKNFTVKATSALTPTWLFDIGYAYSYGAVISTPSGLDVKANSPDINPTLPFPVTLGRIPSVAISGITGVAGFGPYLDFNYNHNGYGNVTKVWKSHAFKFGASYNHYEKNENAGGNNVGSFSFTTAGQPATATTIERAWANFLLGRPASFSQNSEDLTADILANSFEAYGQDDWRVRPNITVSLGVRYSLFSQPTDGNNRISSFDPDTYTVAGAPQLIPLGSPGAGTIVAGTENRTGGIITGGVNSPFGSKVSPENSRNFAPRIGISWDPWGDGKTAVRSGYGIYFDAYAVSTAENTVFSNPPFVQSPATSATLFGNPSAAGFNVNLTPKALRALPYNSKAPYLSQWSLDVQHEFPAGWFVDIGYYGSKGTHLIGQIDLNEVPLGAAQAAGVVTPATLVAASTSSNYAPYNLVRPYKGYGPINQLVTNFGSNYHSLQNSVKKQFKGSSMISVNYTWSKGMTDAISDFITPQNAYNTRAEYGRSEFDRRHVFTANFVYELPFFKNQRSLLGYTVGGWELSGIISANSGLPLTVTTSNLDSGFQGILGASPAGARPFIIGNPAGPKTSLQWFNTAAFAPNAATGNGVPGTSGRGVITGPGYQKWDLSLFKNIPIREALKLQFRAEAFNVWNHTNWDTVSLNTTSSTFGRITGARDARIMQLALKMYF